MKNCTCARALLPPSGGSLPQRTAQRDAVRVWCFLHLERYPDLWFRPIELCRVIHQHYAAEPFSSRSGFSGRLATVKRVLAELEEAGDVERSADGLRWRAFRPGRPAPGRALMRTRLRRVLRHRFRRNERNTR